MANNQSNFIRFQGPYRFQQWSLSDSVIYYIYNNPSTAKAYQKLIRTCKFFFFKNPIIVAPEFKTNNIAKNWEVSTFYQRKTIDFNNATNPLWITNCFDISAFFFKIPLTFVSSIIPHFYRIDAQQVKLINQDISFKEYMFITGNVEVFKSYNTTIKDDDGSFVPLEKLFAALPQIKNFIFYDYYEYKSSCINPNTVNELLKCPRFAKLEEFVLYETPDTFDIKTLFSYVKANRCTKFRFNFRKSISVGYQNVLHGISDEILRTEADGYKCPIIHFAQEIHEKYSMMCSFQDRYHRNF